MTDINSLNDNSSLTEMWRNYFGVWISPPDRVISWLNLSELSYIHENKRGKQLQSHGHHSKLLLLRPVNESHEDLECKNESLSFHHYTASTIDFGDTPNMSKHFDMVDYLEAQNKLEHDKSQINLGNPMRKKSNQLSSKRFFPVNTNDSKDAQNNFENDMSLFAFSATDPLGQQVSPEENRKQNACLWKDLLHFKKTAELRSNHEVFLFHGAGFIDDGSNWTEKVYDGDFEKNGELVSETRLFDFVESNFPCPEKGFLVAISTGHDVRNCNDGDIEGTGLANNELKKQILELARKYQQGGIFEFQKGNKNKIIRSTIPVLISDCDSNAELEILPLKTSSR